MHDKFEIQLKGVDVRLKALERSVDEVKKGFQADPGVARLELQIKSLEKRLNGLERAMEDLRKAYQTDPGVAKLEPKIATLEKQVAVLIASTLTRNDLNVLEKAVDAKDAALWAKANRDDAEGKEFTRKEMKRIEALVHKSEQDSHEREIEKRLAILQAQVDRVETLTTALSRR